jgi:hypothetical protein
VFRRFWNHELELDELPQISGIIASLGGSASAFEAYVNGPARAEHERIIAEAESLGVLAFRRWSSTASCSGAEIAFRY